MSLLAMLNDVKTSLYVVKGTVPKASTDGYFWTGKVYKNNKLVGSVENRGDGGPTNFYGFTKEAMDDLKDFAKGKNKWDCAEILVSELADNYQLYKQIARKAKKSLLAVVKDNPNGGYLQFDLADIPKNRNAVINKYGKETVFLNDLV
jgi:hypothetical protein